MSFSITVLFTTELYSYSYFLLLFFLQFKMAERGAGCGVKYCSLVWYESWRIPWSCSRRHSPARETNWTWKRETPYRIRGTLQPTKYCPPPPAELERTLQPELGTRTKFFTLRQVNMQQRVRTPATCYSATNCTNTPWESRRCVWRQRDNNFKRQTINFCQNCRKRLALLETLKTLPSYLQNHCSTKKKLFLSFLPGYFDI